MLYQITNDVIGSFFDSGTSVLLLGPFAYSSLAQTFENNFCNLPGVCGANGIIAAGCVHSSVIVNIDAYPTIEILVPTTSGGQLSIKVPPRAYIIPANNQYCFGTNWRNDLAN